MRGEREEVLPRREVNHLFPHQDEFSSVLSSGGRKERESGREGEWERGRGGGEEERRGGGGG
jgi:hypothetical protein